VLDHLRERATLALIVSVLFSLALITARIAITGSLTYTFLIWNLFLAGIPYAIVTALKVWHIGPKRLLFWPLLMLWLLFLPNAPYITTDLLHLTRQPTTAIWFDSLLTLSFALNGLILFFLALEPVQRLVARRGSVIVTWAFIATVTALCAFGVYIGRFVRLNSWDALLTPTAVLAEIWNRVTDPFSHPRTWTMTALYTGFLLVTYYMFWTLSRSGQRPFHPRSASTTHE
jgi:uncharacterized membrane protein